MDRPKIIVTVYSIVAKMMNTEHALCFETILLTSQITDPVSVDERTNKGNNNQMLCRRYLFKENICC